MALPDSVAFWWTEMILAIIGVPILIILSITHSYKSIKDACCRSKSDPNKIDRANLKLYNSLIICSLLSILLFTSTNILNIIWMWNWPFIEDKLEQQLIVEWLIKIGTIAWFSAKQAMYYLFLFRLHTSYKTSFFAYNVKYLIIIGIISTITVIINIVNVIIFFQVKGFYYDEYVFAVHFNSHYPFWVIMLAGGPDAIISMLFIYLFIKPLKTVIANIGRTSETEDGITEIYNAGIKALVLTTMCITTTLILSLTILFTNTLIILPIDSVINCICIMMMTPYYSEQRYYQRLCFLAISFFKKYINLVDDISTLDRAINVNPNQISNN